VRDFVTNVVIPSRVNDVLNQHVLTAVLTEHAQHMMRWTENDNVSRELSENGIAFVEVFGPDRFLAERNWTEALRDAIGNLNMPLVAFILAAPGHIEDGYLDHLRATRRRLDYSGLTPRDQQLDRILQFVMQHSVADGQMM
jgi:hypothetical protein